MPRPELEVVHAFVGAMNRRQSRELMDLFTEDPILDAGPRFDRPFAGRPAILGLFSTYWSAMPELTMILREAYATNGGAVAIVSLVARLGPEVPDGIDPSEWRGGKRLGWSGAFRFDLSHDGRIRAVHIYGDDESVRWLPETRVRNGSVTGATD